MTTLFLDIETLPADEAQYETLAYLYARKREKAEQEGREIEDFARFLRNTSFDGAFGRVLCIGYAFDESSTEALVGDEVEMLQAFWELAILAYCKRDVETTRAVYRRMRFIGQRPVGDQATGS